MTPSRNGPLPFGPIALSLSGGGGRAAGFHLGTLSYLDRLDLLQDVRILSTVSGGSFVGASYALALKEARAGDDPHATFARYFESFKETLLNARLLPWALQNMAKGNIHVPSGRHNLVTALAQVYDDTFLHHARFGILWKGPEIHLKDIIFNATEFKTGLAFRFQKSENPCVIGNEHVCIPVAHGRAMRLADVVACSSCIPIGLEPVMFPDDFSWPAEAPEHCAAIKADLRRQCGIGMIPIMDGGVYDNQGIESVILAVRRDPRHAALVAAITAHAGQSLSEAFRPLMAAGDTLGTFIVSDTPLMADEGLATEVPPPPRGVITLRRLDIATRVLTIGSTLTIAYLVGHLFLSSNQLNVMQELDDFFLYAMPTVLAALLLVTLVSVRRKVNALLNFFPQTGHESWTDIRHLTLSQLIDMTRSRLASTWALTSWVYFNRIRQLGYDLLLALPGARRHVIPHEIGALFYDVNIPTLPEWLRPSAAAADLGRRAASLPTQLWFDAPADLDAAIDCGRMTLCFNVLVQLEREYPVRTPAQQRVYDLAKADWMLLQADPSASLPPVTRAAA